MIRPTDGRTDGPMNQRTNELTDQQTDGPMDKRSYIYRVASTRLEKNVISLFYTLRRNCVQKFGVGAFLSRATRPIRHCVGPSVGRSIGPSVGRSVRPAIDFSAFASGFRITAPAQSHETDVVVYTGPPAAPAPHITAPAQPHATMPVRVSGLVF